MRTKKDYTGIVAEVLYEIRSSARLSKAKMADRMCIDERTYGRYESGDSSPALPEFLAMLDRVSVPALPTILRHMYPEVYGLSGDDVPAVRRALADYMMQQASDRDVLQMAYILLGDHGSETSAQLQMFCALDHLKMDVG